MKLYFRPGASSLSPHIALRETDLAFDLEKVDTVTKKTETGADYLAINPKGYVPALQLDDGQVLTEGPAIVQYIADRAPASRLAPAAGTLERYRLAEWLNYISTELHKGFLPLFSPKAPDEWKAVAREQIAAKFGFLAKQLEGKQYLMGDTFTVADGYLFTVLRWPTSVKIDLTQWPVLAQYVERVAARPAVHAALLAEGLIKS